MPVRNADAPSTEAERKLRGVWPCLLQLCPGLSFQAFAAGCCLRPLTVPRRLGALRHPSLQSPADRLQDPPAPSWWHWTLQTPNWW